MPNAEPLISPRISALQYALLFGDESALDQFWEAAAAEGTPLIELIPDDTRHVLVTFLWRAREPIATVGVDGEVFGAEIAPNQMARLLDTELWHKTYRFPRDLRATYMLAPHTQPV